MCTATRCGKAAATERTASTPTSSCRNSQNSLTRAEECCGFGGSVSVTEPAVSARMGRDRLRDYDTSGAEAVVSTDVSCLLHMGGVASRVGQRLPMVHVAEVLAGSALS